MLARRCMQCGCLSPEAESELPFMTPSCRACGCDLLERPPMSYAEMEGFDRDRMPRQSDVWEDALRVRLIQRWIGSVFMILLTGIFFLAIIID